MPTSNLIDMVAGPRSQIPGMTLLDSMHCSGDDFMLSPSQVPQPCATIHPQKTRHYKPSTLAYPAGMVGYIQKAAHLGRMHQAIGFVALQADKSTIRFDRLDNCFVAGPNIGGLLLQALELLSYCVLRIKVFAIDL